MLVTLTVTWCVLLIIRCFWAPFHFYREVQNNSWEMRKAFPETLITLPGKSYVDSDLTSACAALILAPPKTANLKQ